MVVAVTASCASSEETQEPDAPPCECQWQQDGLCYAPPEPPSPGQIQPVAPRTFGLCPTPEDRCMAAVCDIDGRAHRCVEVPLADSDIPPQTDGDCLAHRCVDGTTVAEEDAADVPEATATCMVGVCLSGEPLVVPDSGARCPDGICDEAGECVSDFRR